MLIGSRSKLELLSAVSIKNVPIERVTVYKFLGISTDENLSWKTHINEISKKISAGLSLFVLRHVTANTRETLYKALIMPYFDYSSCVGGYMGKGLSEELQQLQNRASRKVTLSNYETPSKIYWMNLDGRY